MQPPRRKAAGALTGVMSVRIAHCAVALALLSGCAHRTRIVSRPAEANVFIDGRFVGKTPCIWSVPATQLRDDTRVRLELPGYFPVSTELQTEYRVGRIIGGVFTVGLVPLFKWPHTYQDTHFFDLQRMNMDDRLAEIRRMREQGRLTDQEYEKLRIEVLGIP